MTDLDAWGAVTSLWVGSLFLLLIAPVWIGLVLLSVARATTFVAISQVRGRRHEERSLFHDRESAPQTISSIARATSDKHSSASRHPDARSPFAVGFLTVGIAVGVLLLVLLIRYSIWVSNCGPGGCL